MWNARGTGVLAALVLAGTVRAAGQAMPQIDPKIENAKDQQGEGGGKGLRGQHKYAGEVKFAQETEQNRPG